MRVGSRFARRALAPLAALALGSAATPARGDTVSTTYGPFSVQSRGDGQLSTGLFRVTATTGGALTIRYAAPASHCSSVRMHFLVDGDEKAQSEAIGPGGHSGLVDAGPVTAGVHTVAVQAEGVPGGCNVGTLSSWGGTVTIGTSIYAPSLREPAETLGAVVFASNVTSFGWGHRNGGCYVAEDGSIYAYRFEAGDARWSPQPDTRGTYDEAELLDRFAHHRTRAGLIAAAELSERTRAFAALAPGQYAQSAPRAAPDKAASTLVGYRRIPGTNRYVAVDLVDEGVATRINIAPGAEALSAWLRDTLRNAGC